MDAGGDVMSVAVYPRLAQLLEERQLSVAALERQIEQRYGLSVNDETLYRLTDAAPVQRADLEIAGAIAAILNIGLDDLFTVDAVPVEEDGEAGLRVLGPADSQRMAALVGRQAQRLLTEEEWAELEGLVAKYGQLLHERRLRARAQRRGIPLEQERRETEAHLAQKLNRGQVAEFDQQQQALVDQIAEQQAR